MELNMREIKFRAWDKQEKVMLLWNDWSDEIKDAIPHDAGDEWTERCVLMQFTGLHDKNGKENYESDLIKDERTNIIFEIVWNDDFAGWWCVSLDKTIEQPLCNINKYCINIGNTHENTEFIK